MGEQETKLKRGISLPILIFYGVGTILGTGIYILTGKVAAFAGEATPFAFLIAATVAGFTALSYAELSARYPVSAGVVAYIDEAFNNRWMSSLLGWLIVISAAFSTATVFNGFVGYFHEFFAAPDHLVIIGIGVLLGGVAIWGITESTILITIITLIELGGILLFIVMSGDKLNSIPENADSYFTFSGRDGHWTGVISGAFVAFFTFIGFEDIVNEAEEVKNPTRNVPIAVLASVVAALVIYFLVAVISVESMTIDALAAADAPLADIMEQYGSYWPKIISGICLVAILNGSLVQLIMGSRVMYGMADRKLAPKILGKVNKITRTPVIATVLLTGFVIVWALSFQLTKLAEFTDFVLMIAFALVNIALIKVKRDKRKHDGIKFPIILPYIALTLCSAVIVYYLWAHVIEGVV